jgi:hypothetical protein
VFRGVSRLSVLAFALLLSTLAYVTGLFVLALVVLGQGLPRGKQSVLTASAEARALDTFGLIGLLVVGVVFTVAVMIQVNRTEKDPRPQPRLFRSLFGVVVALVIVLSLVDFGIAGAMGWHDFSPGI